MERPNKMRAAARRSSPAVPADASILDPDLLGDVRSLIESARRHVAQYVNSAMVVTYWGVGDRIRRDGPPAHRRARAGSRVR